MKRLRPQVGRAAKIHMGFQHVSLLFVWTSFSKSKTVSYETGTLSEHLIGIEESHLRLSNGLKIAGTNGHVQLPPSYTHTQKSTNWAIHQHPSFWKGSTIVNGAKPTAKRSERCCCCCCFFQTVDTLSCLSLPLRKMMAPRTQWWTYLQQYTTSSPTHTPPATRQKKKTSHTY